MICSCVRAPCAKPPRSDVPRLAHACPWPCRACDSYKSQVVRTHSTHRRGSHTRMCGASTFLICTRFVIFTLDLIGKTRVYRYNARLLDFLFSLFRLFSFVFAVFHWMSKEPYDYEVCVVCVKYLCSLALGYSLAQSPKSPSAQLCICKNELSHANANFTGKAGRGPDAASSKRHQPVSPTSHVKAEAETR